MLSGDQAHIQKDLLPHHAGWKTDLEASVPLGGLCNCGNYNFLVAE